MARPETEQSILAVLQTFASHGVQTVTSVEIAMQLGAAQATVNRYLEKLILNQQIQRTGKGRATRYALLTAPKTEHVANAPKVEARLEQTKALYSLPAQEMLAWGTDALKIRSILSQPIAMRNPITYQRQFVDDYTPNISQLLPPALAESLYQEGQMQGQFPASTYARKVLEQLLIDLSWTSSHLEGNRYSLLDTKKLFELGKSIDASDIDAVMLFNHKDAIEFLIDAVPNYGLAVMMVRNVHAILMNNLLPDDEAMGAIRKKIVNISGTVYLPTQNPHLLAEMLEQIVTKARQVKNPIEAAFFLWINLAYLQPFEDGNKRVSRVCANIPLMLYNCAPLSFLDVDRYDYAQAMLGVYELLDVSMAVDLFVWTYRRSIKKYSVIMQSMGLPDPFRAKYRQQIGEAVRRVIRNGQSIATVSADLAVTQEDQQAFSEMLRNDLRNLDVFNCARYRLTMEKTEEWVKRGRPVVDGL